MKILHVMWKEKFKKAIALFYNKYFNDGTHEILYINESENETLIESEVTLKQHERYTDSSIADAINMLSFINEYDYIVFHSFLKLNNKIKALLLLNGKICRKCIWIEWGADLYSWKIEDGGLKSKIKNWINYKLRNEVGTVVGIFPPDCMYYEENFPKTKANVYYAPYCGPSSPEEYLHYSPECRLNKTKINGEDIYIQIGHNATPTLNHIQALDALKKFRDENIKLLIPLSYGEDSIEYVEKVQSYAEENFPGKTIILRDMISADEYFNLINRVDIAIFNTQRQCGLGNIRRMVFRNVKLYMPENCVMYKYFTEQSVPIQSLEMLERQSFDEFISEAKADDADGFDEFIRSMSDMEYMVNCWNVVYDSLK